MQFEKAQDIINQIPTKHAKPGRPATDQIDTQVPLQKNLSDLS